MVIAEMHQRGADDPMVIVLNEAELESIILRLNHQLQAFLLNYLPTTTNMPLAFVTTLLQKSCNHHLFNEAFNCKWDSNTWVITCPDDKANQKREAERTKDKWYSNIVSLHLAVNQVPSCAHTSVQARYDLDTDKSVTTIHQKCKSQSQ